MIPEEELFIGGYIVRRVSETVFSIENTISGGAIYISEKILAKELKEIIEDRSK